MNNQLLVALQLGILDIVIVFGVLFGLASVMNLFRKIFYDSKN